MSGARFRDHHYSMKPPLALRALLIHIHELCACPLKISELVCGCVHATLHRLHQLTIATCTDNNRTAKYAVYGRGAEQCVIILLYATVGLTEHVPGMGSWKVTLWDSNEHYSVPLWRFCDSCPINKCHHLLTYLLTYLHVLTYSLKCCLVGYKKLGE